MKFFRNQKGFTLIELLIVVAIIGVLAAVGIPMYNGYIASSKNAAAEAGLRAIILMENDFKRENGTYYYTPSAGDNAKMINRDLFGGNKTLDESGYFHYRIRRPANGSTGVWAHADSSVSVCNMILSQNNEFGKAGCD